MSQERTDVGLGTSMCGAAERGRQAGGHLPGTLGPLQHNRLGLGWGCVWRVGGGGAQKPPWPSSGSRAPELWGTFPAFATPAARPRPTRRTLHPRPQPYDKMGQKSEPAASSCQGSLPFSTGLCPPHPTPPHPDPLGLTFGVQLGPVALKAFEPHHVAQQGEELHEGGSCLLVVVHLLLRALARPAVQDAHLALEAQLRWAGGAQAEGSGLSLPAIPRGPWGTDGTLAWGWDCLCSL